MRHLKWLLAVVVLCALAARWPKPAVIPPPGPALFFGEVVSGAYKQNFHTSDSGSSLSMSPEHWTSIVYDPRFGEASMILHCGQPEFDRFVRGLHPYESLFHLRGPGERDRKNPYHEVDVSCGGHYYIWVVPRKRALSKKEQALVGYISGRWDHLAGASPLP